MDESTSATARTSTLRQALNASSACARAEAICASMRPAVKTGTVSDGPNEYARLAQSPSPEKSVAEM